MVSHKGAHWLTLEIAVFMLNRKMGIHKGACGLTLEIEVFVVNRIWYHTKALAGSHWKTECLC